MKAPKTVAIGPFTFTISFDENACNRDAVDSGASDHNFGLMRPLEQRIIVNPRQGPDMARDTVLHEILHALLMSAGFDSETEERIVAPLSIGLLDTLQRNPELVEYLCS